MNKMLTTFLDGIYKFQMHFLKWKLLYLDLNVTKACSGELQFMVALTLVQVITSCLIGDKPLPESMMTQFTNAILLHQAKMS